MGMGMCLNCEHCDPTRTNDLDQVRCKLFHTYVNPSDRCKRYWCDSDKMHLWKDGERNAE